MITKKDAQPASNPFVGRERETAELAGALDDALQGRTRLFLIAGEPGIGKTRLADEIAKQAQQHLVEVLWGRCWEDAGAPPYWPWVAILRSLLRRDDTVLTESLGSRLRQLAQIVPELSAAATSEAIALPELLDAPAARFSLFEVVGETLRLCSERVPLMMIFDDLHAADEASLQLLRFVSRELRDAHLLLIGTYRELEVQRDPARAELVSSIARNGARLPLAGLSAEGVAQLLRDHLAAMPSDELIASVYQATEGNPFFVDEIVRLLAARHEDQAASGRADLRIPHGVRDAIRERLRWLSAEARELMRIAATIGREFEAGLLERAGGLSAAQTLDRLGEAQSAGTIEACGEIGRYRFSHGLIRDVLYDEIPAGARPSAHQRVAAAIEQAEGDIADASIAEVARHYLHAATCGGAAKAIAYAIRAADVAVARTAYEDAAAHYTQGLQALKYVQPPDVEKRCELLLGLGLVQRASGAAEARATFEEAALVARNALSAGAERFAEYFARAALGVPDHGLGMPLIVYDARAVELLEEALASLSPADSALRARLLARLSMETTSAYERPRSLTLSSEAVDMARRLDCPTTLATTLSYRHFVLWRLDYTIDRLPLTSEIIQLAEKIGHRDLAVQGRSWRLVDLISTGDWATFDRELATQAQAAEELRQPRYLWMTANMRALRALWSGEWEHAEALALQALALGPKTGDETPATASAAQIFILRREQGRLQEVEALHRYFAQRFTDTPTPHSTLAMLYSELDRREEARHEFELVAADNFDCLEREVRIGILPHLSEVCAYLGDAARARRLLELLQPCAGLNVPYGGVASFGSCSLYLGLLAATVRDWDAAATHFERAIEHNQRMQGMSWVARSQYAYAKMLLESGVAGRRGADAPVSAATLIASARQIAARLKMTRLAQQLDALEAAHGANVPPPTTTRSAIVRAVASESVSFRLQGDFWCVGREEAPLHVKDTKGTRYLAHLLRHPGREFHATDLALLDAPEEAVGVASGHRRSDIPVLDRRARDEYRNRLSSLREQLDEAREFNDSGRASRLQEELDIITQELGRAMGLHGRTRNAGSFAERARLNVTRAIKSVVRRVRDDNPTLGRYLETTIRTGMFCCYTPDPRLPIHWEL